MKVTSFQESDSSDESTLFNENSLDLLDFILQNDDNGEEVITERINKDGSERKPNRENYGRCPKRPKSNDPWSCKWLGNITHANVNNPSTREGKEFRRKFRVPFPLFQEIVAMCKETDEPFFNIPKYNEFGGSPNIPLELKVLYVLRTLSSGLKFNDAAEMADYISESYGNVVFKKFCELFRKHFQHVHIKPLEEDELKLSVQTFARQ